VFPSELHELAWVTTQRVEQVDQRDAMDIDIVPGEEQFFPGSKSRSEYIKENILTQEMVNELWESTQASVLRLQQDLVDNIRRKEKEKARVERERLKLFATSGKQTKKLVLASAPKPLQATTEVFQYREDELDRKLQEALQQELEAELDQEAARQLRHEWKAYTALARKRHRKQEEEKLATSNRTQKKDKEIGVLAKNYLGTGAQCKWNDFYGIKPALKLQQMQTKKHELTEKQANISEPQKQQQTAKGIMSGQAKPNLPPVPTLPPPIPALPPPAPSLSKPATLQHPPEPVKSSLTFGSSGDIQPRLGTAPTVDPEEQKNLSAAIATSKKEARDNAEQIFIRNALAVYKTVPEALKDQGFSTMKEYLNAATGTSPPSSPRSTAKSTTAISTTAISKTPTSTPTKPAITKSTPITFTLANFIPPKFTLIKSTPTKQKDLQVYLTKLRQAYLEGAQAGARVSNLTLEQYTNALWHRSPSEGVDFQVGLKQLTEDDMPDLITNEMSAAEDALARKKWSRLCDILIEAYNFEAQVRLEPEIKYTADGKRYAII
jgi:hypothetical protein